ncbi:TPA: gp53-like domain-containing protein [Citrobacter freundii]
MATNNFKPFATAANANVMSQADWEALPALLSGFISGPAKSAQVNKAIRQASFIAAALAQYTANKSGMDVLDDGDLNGFISKMGTAFGKDFQALDATLTALAGLATGANKLPYFTGNDTAAQTDLTSVGRDIIGKSTIADILTYLGLTALGIGGQGTKLPALDWQTFDFVPGAIYYVSSTDITNMPAGIFTPSSKATLVLNVSGYDGITRHIDMWWATGTTDYRKYQVVVVGFSGNKTFTVRQIFTSSGIVPVEYGGTGASTVDDVLRNWGVAKALEEKQPKDVTLTALAALVGAANKIPYFNGDDTAALTDLSQVGRDIIGKRDIAGLIQYLGISDLKVLDSTDNKWLWKLPNGVIFQVFKTDVQNTSTIGVSLDNMVTFPVAFPSECFAVLICKATYVQIIASAEIPTRTQCKIVTIPVTTPIATWTTTTILAIGR